jgi:tetratricopeptide (TPR) repeat protein
MLGNSLRAREGWSAETVKAAYSRAMQLCDRDTPNEMVFGPLFGLWAWHFVRPLLTEAEELAERLMFIAASIKEPEYEVFGRQALGFTYFAQGRFENADFQLERCIRLCNHRNSAAYLRLSGQDPIVHARLYRAMTLWFLGLPDRAVALAREALQYAQSTEYLFSEAMARAISLRIYQFRGEPATIADQAQPAIALSKEHAFGHYFATNLFSYGWARAVQGEIDAGSADLLESLKLQRANGGLICETYTLGLLGDACIKNGRYEQALGFLQQAARTLETHYSALFYGAEIYRLMGEAHSRLPGGLRDAERFLAKGLKLAREQKAKSLELKLAITSCELYNDGEDLERSRASLRELVQSFHEGHDTPDLITARSLLTRASAPTGKPMNRRYRKPIIAKRCAPRREKCL